MSSAVHMFAILLTSFLIASVSMTSRRCHQITVKHGLYYLNCSRGDWIGLPPPDALGSAEVLDFSENSIISIPALPESRDCDRESHCDLVNNTDNNCRLAISFSRNEIFSMAEHAFRDLHCLCSLDLSYNRITGQSLEDSFTFKKGTDKIETLIMRGNPLGILPDNVFSEPYMPRLRHLDLSYCELEEIGENSVDSYPNLRTLDLSNNRLTQIKHATFKGLTTLKYLYLHNNRLQSLGHQVFGDLTNLYSLLLSNNSIQSFARHSFYDDSTLKILDISTNKLTEIPYHSLQELTKLSHLVISNNPIKTVANPNKSIVLSSVQVLEMNALVKLTSLDNGALASFPSLTSLSIRRIRNLKTVHSKFLGSDASKLRGVYLENNGLYTLPGDALPWKNLTTLRLDGNRWLCDYRLQWMIRAEVVTPDNVICADPIQLSGRDIKTLDSRHLQQYFTTKYITSIIIAAIVVPSIAIVLFLAWRRRHSCACCHGIHGRYVTVFTRDTDGDGDDKVDFELKLNQRRLRAVSNGVADDTKPFITMDGNEDEDEEEEIPSTSVEVHNEEDDDENEIVS